MNDIIKCMAIDDEPLALEIIKKFCERIGNIDLHTFSDPVDALEFIKSDKTAVVFLDIEMENVTGLEIAAQLPSQTCFIFTTAYLNYAIDGYELDAVDYLHKPFAFSRFQTAFNKALRRISSADSSRTAARSILVKHEYSNVNIPLNDIIYIEAMEGYVKIFREGGTCTVSRVILKNIGNQLPENEFIRIHRSYIVNKSKIKSFTKREIVLNNGRSLPIGRQYAPNVISSL